MTTEVQFQLKGWQAAVVAILILGAAGYRIASHNRTLDPDQREVVRAWLVKDAEGLGPRGLAQKALRFKAGLPDTTGDPGAEPTVDLVTTAAHGSRTTMVVQVRYTVNGEAPAGVPTPRYLVIGGRQGSGWTVYGDSDPYRYLLALLR